MKTLAYLRYFHQYITTMKSKNLLKLTGGLLAVSLISITTPLSTLADAATPYIARWALIIPGGGAGWLGVERVQDGSLESSMLWGGGSPFPLTETKMRGDTLVLTRVKKDNKTKKTTTELYEAKVEGSFIKIDRKIIDDQGKIKNQVHFNGKKIPPHDKAPDFATLQYGDPIPLLNGKDLTGWKAMNEKAPNCWSVKDGILSNRVTGPDGKKQHGTNIRTERVFNDFRLTTDVRVPEHGNSGIYLRGIYEIQVAESYGKPADCHHLGALYGRITPSETAERKPNEWQNLDITLCDRYVTVILNGKKIIDNQPAMGCTGGAMTSDEFAPGPIYLQGDHTDVDYRNMVLTPIIK
jgi:hypothetical protein